MNLRSTCVLALVTGNLAACVVVPVDPRTGQPVSAPPMVVYAPPSVPPAPVPSTWSVRLYPLNESATQIGMLSAIVVGHQSGRGTFSVNYRGETLQGEATRGAGNKGVANAYGGRGTSAQCEYTISAARRGTGLCQFSDGARYQMHSNE